MNTSQMVMDYYKRAEMYDIEYSGLTEDIPFYFKLAGEFAEAGYVLEFACGTGRITLPLAQAGINITGVDITYAMLEVARKKLARMLAKGEIAHEIPLLEGDMRSFDAGKGQYSLVFVPFNSFLHLNDRESQESALANAYAHLKPGGYFLGDIFLPDILHLARDMGPNWVNQEKVVEWDGKRLVRWVTVRYDQSTQLMTGLWYYKIFETFDGNKELESYCIPAELRVIFPAEWELLLERAGFKIVQKWGGFNHEPFNGQSKRMFFLCQK